MRNLSFLIFVFAVILHAQSPHGASFNKECSDCHSDLGWSPLSSTIKFRHAETGFPLIGQHQSVSCKSCHNTLVFSGTKSNCVSCHTNIHKNSVSPECSNCHTPQSWVVPQIRQMHSGWRFPLLGQHLNADCNSCHTKNSDLNFEAKGVLCYDCHKPDYQQTKTPNHQAAGFSTDCSQCHTVTSATFKTVTTDHSFFPLQGGHNLPNCFSCHTIGSFKGLNKDCYSCHKKDYDRVVNPNHVTLNFEKNCTTCHNTNAWKPALFNHSTTQFALTGAHSSVSCASCHSSGFAGTPKECVSCHRDKFNSVVSPNHRQLNFSEDCKTCHTTAAWKPATFDHDGPFFPVYSGAHKGKWSACTDCHKTASNYKDYTCISCHEHNQQSMDREHRSVGGYTYNSTACFNCHPRGSSNGAFNHSTSQFPLTGAHITTDCALCHTQGYGTANKPPADCKTCHEQKLTTVNNPNHTKANFINKLCTDCHGTTAWKPSSYNHQQATGYQLLGGHALPSCNDCHKTTYANTTKVCFGCHEQSFNNTRNPNHTTLQLSHDCTTCHTIADWAPATFDHPNSAFPFTGGHTGPACIDCHRNGYTNTPQQCVSCHEAKYNQTQNPNHAQIGMDNNCKNCHNTVDWQHSTFNHQLTTYPLTGTHTTTACNKCHIQQTTGTPTLCKSCHQAKYDQSRTPNHQQVGLSVECKDCHNTTHWTPGTFDHQTTAYPLTGAHITADCIKCHVGQTTGTAKICKTCHQNDFNQSQNPNHRTLGISAECKDCHSTSAWAPSSFDHQATNYPLTGGHITVACNKCHTTQTTGTTTVCYDCHTQKFQQTTNPNHTALALSTQCKNCHTTNPQWKPALFPDHNNYWAFQGAHITIKNDCQSCHNGQYSNTPKTCVGCHLDDFNRVTSPNHRTLLYPTDCLVCHTQVVWKPATFNHDGSWYKIYSGAHRGRWTNCNQCHQTATNYRDYTCISCHEHDQTTMATRHRNVRNYQYLSSACYNCHRNTILKTAVEEHPEFALQGVHKTLDCSNCHKAEKKTTDCASCHQQEFKTGHRSVGDNACYKCHNTFTFRIGKGRGEHFTPER